jgi:hypothetical protein
MADDDACHGLAVKHCGQSSSAGAGISGVPLSIALRERPARCDGVKLRHAFD